MNNVLENFLPKLYANDLEAILCGEQFSWFYLPGTDSVYFTDSITAIKNTKNTNTKDSFQFCHSMFHHGKPVSKYYDLIYPIVYHISEIANKDYTNKVMRIKANLLTKINSVEDDSHHYAHVDQMNTHNQLYSSFLYYVNDSDGDTFFFEELWSNPQPSELTLQKKVSPKKNSGVLFNSSQYHASSSPVKNKIRCVISFIFNEN
jgi:hypothetical protein